MRGAALSLLRSRSERAANAFAESSDVGRVARAAFLVSNGIFRRLLHPRFPTSHIYGLGVLVVATILSPWCDLLALSSGELAALLVTIFVSYNLVARA